MLVDEVWMHWTVEEMREQLQKDSVEDPVFFQALAAHAARAVQDNTCTCCPGEDVVQLECGHFLCQRCNDSGHCCIACALQA